MIFKQVTGSIFKNKWEQVPDEDLWEDGELSPGEVHYKIYRMVVELGEWTLIREHTGREISDDS